MRTKMGFNILLINFGVKMVSRRPGRHLKTFLEPVASFSLSMSPWRAMVTPNVPKSRVLGHYVASQGHFCFAQNDPLFFKSQVFPWRAASGGNYSPKMTPYSLKVRYSLGALPPAAIFHKK